MPRKGSADYVVDPDRGSGSIGVKKAELVDIEESRKRDDSRDGLRELDEMVQTTAGMHWTQKARQRLMPRAATAALGHPRMARPLPASDEIRLPLSERQWRARENQRRSVKTADTGRVVVFGLTTDEQEWAEVNDRLSDLTGDIQELDDDDQATVRRVDRFIQDNERHNTRGHVVYTNVAMPSYINKSNIKGFINRVFKADVTIDFDRFTAGTHQMHELRDVDPDRNIVFEIQTRRGAYLGHGSDDTSHLLPRGTRYEVVAVHDVALFRGPDGQEGQRIVVQLRDIELD